MPVAQFMRRHWQRRPLLVRKAIADAAPPVDARKLFVLAGRDDVEARLVTSFDGWRLQHGPIPARRIPPRTKRGWTLLVQGVDLHDDRAAALLERFRFIADARLDDLMISYASDGGGVGPHIDAYDVFLLQVQGQRRWRIGTGDPHDLVPKLPLKVLRRFKATDEWVLDPGDLLYLPPGVAHEGTALGADCMTCSIGFRAPEWHDLSDPWLETLLARGTRDGRYTDPGTPPTSRPARLPPHFVDAAFAALTRRRPTRTDARDMLLAFLTEPKPRTVFSRPRRALSASDLRCTAHARGLRLDRRTRMLYAGKALAINGELLSPAPKDQLLMQLLADRRSLTVTDMVKLGASSWSLLAEWQAAGWLHVNS